MDELHRRRLEFLRKILNSRMSLKRQEVVDDDSYEGEWTDSMREVDFLDGLPIPYGDELLVNPL